MMDLNASQGQSINKDELIQSCKSQSAFGDVKSYKIIEESVNGDTATVKIEVITNSEGKEQTESDTFTMNKRDGVWKISLQ